MEIKIINDILELKSEIVNSSEYKEFKIAEEKLENDEEVAILSYKKDMAIVNYEDTLKHFRKDSPEALISKENLDKIIRIMNSHPIVKEYNSKLTQLNLLLNEVEELVMGDIND